jgi:hypothetical protein
MKVDPFVVYTREQVVANLRTAVASSPVGFDFLLKQAEIESGLNPNAKASTSSASGPFQFVNATWLRMVEKYGDNVGLSDQAAALRENKLDATGKADVLALRNDVAISGKMAAHFALDNAKALASSGLTNIGPTELYLAHFLGASGAKEFLAGMQADPSGAAAEVLPSAARSNTNVFFNNGAPRSFSEIYNRFAQKFAGVPAPLSGPAEALLQRPDAPTMDGAAASQFDITQASQFDLIAQETLAEARVAQGNRQRVQAERLGQAEQAINNSAELTTAMAEMSEAALSHYLASFSKNFEDPSKAPIEMAQADLRDASRGVSEDGNSLVVGQNLFAASDVAMGMKIVMEAAGRKPTQSEHAAGDANAAPPVTAPAVKQAVQWVSLFSDTRGVDAAQAGRS